MDAELNPDREKTRSKHAATLMLALYAHTSFGLYVVLVKYLMGYLPAFGMLAVTFGAGALTICIVARRRIHWDQLWSRGVWLLSFIMVARSITKLLAVQHTLASYVQLIDLMVPFLTPIFAYFLLKESMPSGTIPALLATSLGSFLVITINPLQARLPNGTSDLIGIGLAFVSALAMTLGVVFTRQLSTRQIGPFTLFSQQLIVLSPTYALLSISNGESWRPFLNLTGSGWMVFVAFGLITISGGLIQVLSISRTRAVLFSTLLSWRLVVAVVGAWILLGERLVSLWQAAGLVIVLVAISLYVQHQGRQQSRTARVGSAAG
jgi:drug/metabolite transporter (DMT)-like permease